MVIKRLLLAMVIITGSYTFLLTLLPQDMRMIGYLTSSDHNSSILGGLFSFLPALIAFYLIHRYCRIKINQFPFLRNDILFSFLYRFSVIPVAFIGIAINTQIVGQRFILPAILFQILLIFYVSRFNSKKQNFSLIRFSSIYFTFLLIYIYVLPAIIIGSENSQRVITMLNSNTILNYFLQ